MTQLPNGISDRPPSASSSSWVFGVAGATFLLALVMTGLAMPAESGAQKIQQPAPEIALGRAIFYGEGCISCHSRLVRPRDRGMGPVADEAVLSSDMSGSQGSSRLGPDLQNLAKRYPASLLRIRLTDPNSLQPGTLMPAYAFLGDTRLNALIAYLEQPVIGPSKWEAVRATNRIEAAVPDSILGTVSGYIDPKTNVLTPPIQHTQEFLIPARGIYNSRCAACHGLEGRGDGPVSWKDWTGSGLESGPVSPVPPADFTTLRFSSYSDAMWYWRISEGVPGTQMPSWKSALSEDAVWYLIGFLHSLTLPQTEEEMVVGEEIQGSVVPVEGPFGPESWDYSWGQQNSTASTDLQPGDVAGQNINSDNAQSTAGGASEEEGANSLGGETSRPDSAADNRPAGEETP